MSRMRSTWQFWPRPSERINRLSGNIPACHFGNRGPQDSYCFSMTLVIRSSHFMLFFFQLQQGNWAISKWASPAWNRGINSQSDTACSETFAKPMPAHGRHTRHNEYLWTKIWLETYRLTTCNIAECTIRDICWIWYRVLFSVTGWSNRYYWLENAVAFFGKVTSLLGLSTSCILVLLARIARVPIFGSMTLCSSPFLFSWSCDSIPTIIPCIFQDDNWCIRDDVHPIFTSRCAWPTLVCTLGYSCLWWKYVVVGLCRYPGKCPKMNIGAEIFTQCSKVPI